VPGRYKTQKNPCKTKSTNFFTQGKRYCPKSDKHLGLGVTSLPELVSALKDTMRGALMAASLGC